jgi:ABC-2 type transport system permease protein
VSALVEREGLLRKVRFPRMVIPLSVLLTAVLNLGGTLAAAVIFAGLSGAYPTWGWLQLPLFIGVVGAFAMGLGMLLGALFVRYRDIKPIWDVVSQTLFYASPILYVTTTVPEAYQHAYAANPLAATFAQMRHAMLDPAAPTAWEATGGAVRLLVPIGIVVIAIALGWWVFRREAPRIAEHL